MINIKRGSQDTNESDSYLNSHNNPRSSLFSDKKSTSIHEKDTSRKSGPKTHKIFNADNDSDNEENDIPQKTFKSHSVYENIPTYNFEKVLLLQKSGFRKNSSSESNDEKEDRNDKIVIVEEKEEPSAEAKKSHSKVNLVSFSVIETERGFESGLSLPEIFTKGDSKESLTNEIPSRKKSTYDIESAITSIIKISDQSKESSNNTIEISDSSNENFTNTQDILNFYDYTKDCYNKIMVEVSPKVINSMYQVDYVLDKSKCIKYYFTF